MAHPALANLGGLDLIDLRLLEEFTFLAQDTGFCTPGRRYLSDTVGVSVRTISRHLTKLCKLGHLRRQLRSYRRADGKVRNRTNLYRVSVDAAARVKSFLTTIGQRLKAPITGGTRLSHIPKAKTKISNKVSTPHTAPAPNPTIFEKIPLLKRWLERGSAH